MSEDLAEYVRPAAQTMFAQEGHHHLPLLQVRLGIDRDRDRDRDRGRDRDRDRKGTGTS